MVECCFFGFLGSTHRVESLMSTICLKEENLPRGFIHRSESSFIPDPLTAEGVSVVFCTESGPAGNRSRVRLQQCITWLCLQQVAEFPATPETVAQLALTEAVRSMCMKAANTEFLIFQGRQRTSV